MKHEESRPIAGGNGAAEAFGGAGSNSTSGHSASSSGRRSAPRSREQLVRETTQEYIRILDSLPAVPEPEVIEPRLLNLIQSNIVIENVARAPGNKLARASALPPLAIALVMLRGYRIVVVRPAGMSDTEARAKGMLAIYVDEGPDRGMYVGQPQRLRAIVQRFNSELNDKQSDHVLNLVRARAEVVAACDDRDKIAVDNGVFDYRSKELLPFSPDLVFTSKVRTAYDAGATVSPKIEQPDGTSWTIDEWLVELFDDVELTALAWAVLSAAVRPLVNWDKVVYPFDESGENGKGTFVKLVRELVGIDSCASISIADFADKFRLAQILGKTLVAVDENDVGAFSDRLANFKAVVTGDMVSIEDKFEKAFSYAPHVFMIQCLNSFPKAKDTSRSFYRRQLFWPFAKSYTGRANAAIKEDYVTRRDVREYVLHRVLHDEPFYRLPEPEACRRVLDEFKTANDSVRDFWEEFADQFVWDLLPTAFLHDLYVSWSRGANPSGKPLSKIEFARRLTAIVREHGDWVEGSHRIGTRMNAPETLIAHFDLERWMCPSYSGKDLTRLCAPVPPSSGKHRGLLRVQAAAPGGDDDNEDPSLSE